ncbi:MAG: C39 family peptidase [Betaproteobacteria bacterium]
MNQTSFVACCRWAGLAGAALTLAGCQTLPAPGSAPRSNAVVGDFAVPVLSWRQARLAGTLLQQYDFSCGSAAVATLLTHHYGLPTSEGAVFERMFAQGDQARIRRDGFSMLDLKRALAAYGLQADGFEQPLEKLLEAGLPAIVLISENGYQHFVVVKGLAGERVLIGDPAKGTRAISRRAFDEAWRNRLLLVVHNRLESARFNLAADWAAAPSSPLATGVSRGGLAGVTLPKHGPGDF